MRRTAAAERPLHDPEVVLNLWAYAGSDGYVRRLAGKAYVMDGDEEQKVALLRSLSSTDFLSATCEAVPKSFRLMDLNGRLLQGVTLHSIIGIRAYHSRLFGPLMERLAQGLPEQAKKVAGTYSKFRMELPEDPLTVTTVVVEYDDGRLVPVVTSR